ncbi:hypothetical protein ACINWC323_1820 [Acinetobacter sp. WC-323]|uniref:hypothetical protein n=1 Tax=Acinetobacter sp. WC-323 TaxID=903918 RepID=UPI00029EA7E9|nr:hypothetical protein [Acinetobacter sp. WC-323]EKU51460.1 hypothetical protein ACINWC323_1820 [Acinetobacter sp. WC-323]
MQKQRYTTPFAQYTGKDVNGFYNVRLGPKIYLLKVSLNYTPEFDTEFFGGIQAAPFDWNTVLVKDTIDSQPRPIHSNELAMKWLKSNLKRIINYHRAIKRNADSQTMRYSKEQRIDFRNAQYNAT